MSHSYPFSLGYDSTTVLLGHVMEGHPERGCPGDPSCDQNQDHEDVVFEIDGSVIAIYEDSEHGPQENAWFYFAPLEASVAVGDHTLTFRHTLHGDGPQSVDYKYSFCARPDIKPTPTPTATPSLTATAAAAHTPTPSATATHTPTHTPAKTATP